MVFDKESMTHTILISLYLTFIIVVFSISLIGQIFVIKLGIWLLTSVCTDNQLIFCFIIKNYLGIVS